MPKPSTEYLLRIAIFVLGSLSIGSLLLYFFGVGRFVVLATVLSLVEIAGLAGIGIYAASYGNDTAKRILKSGIWVGFFATLVYDIVRIPIAHSGIPVFKAISYFGTVFTGIEHPTVSSEILGWGYHLSNGVSFGLMYAALKMRPEPISAVLWGLSLEAAMLVTPYAEVFGYQRDLRFFAITMGSHAAYGLSLWLGLRQFCKPGFRMPSLQYWAMLAGVPLGLVLVATDFHHTYATTIPQSPPEYIGPKLFTVWNVPEPDRLAAIWIMKRFVDPRVQFYFIEPFEKIRFGAPFDVPEAEIRRHGLQSASEFLVAQRKLNDISKLKALAHMTNLTEVTPWALATDADAARLAELVRRIAGKACGGPSLHASCLNDFLAGMDEWYGEEGR